MKKLVTILIFLAISIWFAGQIFQFRPAKIPNGALKPETLQAHRGKYSPPSPENKLATFNESQQRGIKMMEIDIRLSKDKVPVVIHDKYVESANGATTLVTELSASQLWNNFQVPSLDLVLKKVSLKLNLEIKTSAVFDDQLETEVAKVVTENKAQNRVMFSSFNPFSVRRMSQLFPEVPRALVNSADPTIGGNSIVLRRRWLAFLSNAHFLFLDEKMITRELAAELKTKQIPFGAWTVNDKNRANQLIDLGAQTIISEGEWMPHLN